MKPHHKASALRLAGAALLLLLVAPSVRAQTSAQVTFNGAQYYVTLETCNIVTNSTCSASTQAGPYWGSATAAANFAIAIADALGFPSTEPGCLADCAGRYGPLVPFSVKRGYVGAAVYDDVFPDVPARWSLQADSVRTYVVSTMVPAPSTPVTPSASPSPEASPTAGKFADAKPLQACNAHAAFQSRAKPWLCHAERIHAVYFGLGSKQS